MLCSVGSFNAARGSLFDSCCSSLVDRRSFGRLGSLSIRATSSSFDSLMTLGAAPLRRCGRSGSESDDEVSTGDLSFLSLRGGGGGGFLSFLLPGTYTCAPDTASGVFTLISDDFASWGSFFSTCGWNDPSPYHWPS